MNGVCANSCHAQDSACAAVWAAANANASLANCEAACRQCAQCRFASFSLVEGVCVWQERCKLLQLPGEDFRTLKLKRQRDRRQERALASAATTPGMPGCIGALPCRDPPAWAYLSPGLRACRLGFPPHASAPSDRRHQRQVRHGAASSLGQPPPTTGRFVLAGRLDHPALHIGATRSMSRGRRRPTWAGGRP